jgi:5-methylcytosine-specific restriction protein A
MAFVLKADLDIDVQLGESFTATVPAYYGGQNARRGDDVFVWSSNYMASGLAYRGILQAKRKAGDEFKVTVKLDQNVNSYLGNGHLVDYRDSKAEDGISGIARKLFRHSHDKLAALTDVEAEFLSGYFDAAPTSAVETIPFERGKFYNRRADIHIPYAGQEQGGITTPKSSPFIFLFTGEEGGRYGYRDEPRTDGLFEYTGEGQAGDMQFVRGNKAIRDHVADGKELLLFRTLKKKGSCEYLGSYLCEDYIVRPGVDKNNVTRDTIVFLLAPIENLHAAEEAMDGPPPSASINDLKEAAYAAAAAPQGVAKGSASRNIYVRSRAVRDYVLKRANGICERCKLPAPFARKDGTPYLEPHHTRRVSDGGPDHPRWVGAICPSCHRHIHYGQSGATLNEELQIYLGTLEP